MIFSISSCMLKKKNAKSEQTGKAQNKSIVKSMITMSGKDTISIKRFDSHQNLIYHKIFPQFGISQILGWTYSNNHLKRYTWSHSNIGFKETEYEYDSITNTSKEFTYETKEKFLPKQLMIYNNLVELKRSKEFQSYIKDGTRILKGLKQYKDSLLIKELEYKSKERVDTIYYTYLNNQLVKRKHCYGHNNAYNELIYKYDESGNEISWMKVYNSKDTSVVYKKDYKNGLLYQKVGIEKGKIESTETYEYIDKRLISKVQVDASGVEKISLQYTYDQDGRIDFVDEQNKYLGQNKRTYYVY